VLPLPRPGRSAGSSGVWTPPVSPKAGAPHAFCSALRAPLHARETRSTGCAGRAAAPALPTVLTVFDSTEFPAPAARGAGTTSPSWLSTHGCVSGRRAASAIRLPLHPSSTTLGRDAIWGLRAAMPLPHAPPYGWAWFLFGTRLRPIPARLRLANEVARTVPDRAIVAVDLPRQPALAHRVLSAAESVAHPWRKLPSPHSSQASSALRALLHLPCGLRLGSALALCASSLGPRIARATNSGRTAESKHPLNAEPERLRGL
jgi:hypothetical protein